jgi:hypothetical protein
MKILPAIILTLSCLTGALAQGPPGPPRPEGRHDGEHRGPRRGGGRGWDRPGGFRAQFRFENLSEDERQAVVHFMLEHFPEASAGLQRMREEKPTMFVRKMRRLYPEIARLMRSRDRDPENVFKLRVEEFKNETQIYRLARRIRSSGYADETNLLRESLREHVRRAFDIRQELLRTDIQRMEARLASLREKLEKDEQQRERIIEKDVERRISGHRGPKGKRHHHPRGHTPTE